ncbi:conserved hypothetical protein [Ricinus communis]|uniref:Uncharacterized protein n=1 Tax=Ricinus communis TaxID=3988 RepID=B9T5K6_RICCO|nr:conserved hypothetical protein [Ricinus communis]
MAPCPATLLLARVSRMALSSCPFSWELPRLAWLSRVARNLAAALACCVCLPQGSSAARSVLLLLAPAGLFRLTLFFF